MLYESRDLQLIAEPPFATLWIDRPRSRELHAAFDVVERTLSIEKLVIRSVNALRFSADCDLAFLDRLADSPIITLAFLEGIAAGRSLELAMACQYRLAVASPDTWLGFSDGFFTAREARAAKHVDDAFTRRRAKIELQSWLDRARPRSRRPAVPTIREPNQPMPLVIAGQQLPKCVGVFDCPNAIPIAVELLLRGRTIITNDPHVIRDRLTVAAVRGRATPLELEHAATRMRTGLLADAEYVLIGEHTRRPHGCGKHAIILRPGSGSANFSWLGWSGQLGWAAASEKSLISANSSQLAAA